MTRLLTKKDIYLQGTTHRPIEFRGEGRVHILGDLCGPRLLVVDANCYEALDEWDKRHGLRVDDYDPDLNDYPGEDVSARISSAMDCGDIRVNDGGTTVWVGYDEWMRSFATVRDAGAYWKSLQ